MPEYLTNNTHGPEFDTLKVNSQRAVKPQENQPEVSDGTVTETVVDFGVENGVAFVITDWGRGNNVPRSRYEGDEITDTHHKQVEALQHPEVDSVDTAKFNDFNNAAVVNRRSFVANNFQGGLREDTKFENNLPETENNLPNTNSYYGEEPKEPKEVVKNPTQFPDLGV